MDGWDYLKRRDLHPSWDESRDPNKEDVVDAYEQGKADGAKEMKEQMMKKAVDGRIVSCPVRNDIEMQSDEFKKATANFKDGQKVKVIIVKED